MLQVVIDWVGRQFGRNRPRVIEVRPSPSEMGFRFQREEFEKLFSVVGHWASVEFFTAWGMPIDAPDDLPRGPDGGVDGVIRITAQTEHGAKIVAGRIRTMLVRQSY
jgi:hypothetical protein